MNYISHTQVLPNNDFDVEAAANKLKDAMKGFGMTSLVFIGLRRT